MRWKWFVTIGVLLIIALMAAGYVMLGNYDYNKLKPRVARMIKEVTGRELNLAGEIDLTIGFSPTLTVSDVAFANASWGSQPQMIKIKQVEAQVRLLPLLFKDLELKRIGFVGVDVLLETDKTGRGNWDFSAEDSSAGKTRAFKLRNIDIDKIRIEKLNLTFRDGETDLAKRLALASLEVAKQGAIDTLALDLKADYNGQQLTLAGKIGLIHFLLAHERFPFELAGKFSNATVKINGAINDVLSLQGIDLQARVSGTNLAELKLGIGSKLPRTNVFDLTGHLKGSKEALALEDVNGKLSGSAVDLVISGSFGDLIALSGMNLHVKGSGKNLAEVGAIIDQKLPATDEFIVQGRLTGSAKALSLQAAQGSARRGDLGLALDGGIKDLIYLKGIDLKVKGSGKNLAQIGTIVDQKLPATDVFKVQGRLTGSAKVLSLKDAQGSAKRDSLSVALSGEVKDLIAFSGLDLRLKGSGKNLAEIGSIIGEKLPATDEFAVEGRLMGSAETLSLQSSQGRVSRGGLRLRLDGGIKNLLALTGIDIKFKGSGADLAEVGAIIEKKLPTTDNFAVRGRLMGSTKALSLREATGRAGRNGMSIAFDGVITDVLALRSIDIRLKASGKELAEIGPLVGTNLPKLGPFDVRGHLIGSAKLLLLNEFSAIVDKSDFKDARLEFGLFTLNLQEGDFSIDRLEATYKQTKISGNLHIDPGSPPQLATNFLVQNFDLGDFLKETGKSDQVRGIVDIAAHGKSSGDSVSSLMAHLNGAFGAVMGPGYLTKYLDLLSMDLSTKVIPFWGRHKKADEINCAVVQFDIKNGVAVSKGFVFDSQIGILSATGDTNLGTEQVNFLLNPRPKDFSLVNLSTKMRVTGTLMDAKVRPDTLSLVKRGAEEVLGFLALGPLGLLAPFVHLGAHEKHPCDVQGIRQLEQKISTND